MENRHADSGTVEYKHLGVRFQIPDGWIGRETSAGYLIGSHTEPGFALIRTSGAKSLIQLENLAREGISDEYGTRLVLTGTLEPVTDQGLGGEFGGTFEGTPAQTYIAGLVNPQGTGILVLSGAVRGSYTALHRQLAFRIARSVEFFSAEIPASVLQWREKLQKARLTYMDSYFRNDGGVDIGGTVFGTGGGFSNTVEIHLCEQGRFRYKQQGNIALDGGGTFGGSAGGSRDTGVWEVSPDADGAPLLHLYFHHGGENTYRLEYREDKVWLNGRRYFLTYGTDGADCG